MDDRRDRWFLGTLTHLRVTSEDSSGVMTVIEQLAPRGFSPPLHVHDNQDGMLRVLEGAVTVTLGEITREARTGEVVFLPKGVPHTFRVETATARVLKVSTPGGFDRFVRENSTPASAPTLPPEPAPIDIEALGRSAARHGAPLVGPALPCLIGCAAVRAH